MPNVDLGPHQEHRPMCMFAHMKQPTLISVYIYTYEINPRLLLIPPQYVLSLLKLPFWRLPPLDTVSLASADENHTTKCNDLPNFDTLVAQCYHHLESKSK